MKNLAPILNSCNFKVNSADHSLFVKNDNLYITIILVYIDDIIIIGNNQNQIKEIKAQLKSKFGIKNLGYLKYFLGIEIAYSQKSLFLSQIKYIIDLWKETKKFGCKSISTPIDSRKKLNTEEGEPLKNINQYQRFVGKLIYLTVTRPDLAFAVIQVSQFMHAPRLIHMETIDRILRYLKKTPGKEILMKK
jgi:Reverse transcriptase (RNA-dependent DNA polymerase)